MAYSEFTLDTVQSKLGLQIEEKNLFADCTEHPLSQDFKSFLHRGVNLALAVNTEKAKSEFIIAPLLLEVKEALHDNISIFSGIEFNIAPEQGLNGVCDFLVSRSGRQHVLTAPLVTVVEAKNDNLRDGFGQCIAEMYAAQQFNLRHEQQISRVHGIVTIGSSWKFLCLEQATVIFDVEEYFK